MEGGKWRNVNWSSISKSLKQKYRQNSEEEASTSYFIIRQHWEAKQSGISNKYCITEIHISLIPTSLLSGISDLIIKLQWVSYNIVGTSTIHSWNFNMHQIVTGHKILQALHNPCYQLRTYKQMNTDTSEQDAVQRRYSWKQQPYFRWKEPGVGGSSACIIKQEELLLFVLFFTAKFYFIRTF